MFRLITLEIIALCILLFLQEGLVQGNSCVKFTLDDTDYDLTDLVRTAVPYEYQTHTESGLTKLYLANICSNLEFAKGCIINGQPAQNVVAASFDVAAGCEALGNVASDPWKYVDPSKPEMGLVGNFSTDGEKPTITSIFLSCDSSVENSAVLNSVTQLNRSVKFYITTSKVCSSTSASKGQTGLSVFLVILLSGTLVYCVGGVLWNLRNEDVSGIEAIPHYEFWREVPKLLWDSCNGLLNIIRTSLGLEARFEPRQPHGESSGRYAEI